MGNIVLSPEAKRNVNRVLNTSRLSYGPFSRKFESKFARLHESRFGIVTNSGTSSLQIAFAALKEKHNWSDGDEIIVPSLTFIATSNTVIQNGLRPVFVDVLKDTYTLNPELIESNITEKTKGIAPVHLLGLPCDMTPIMQIAKRHGLKIVEDSAECFLARYRGKSVGSFGEIGVFSTYVAHHIVTGVGGISVTSDPELAILLRSLANHGRDSIYLHIDDDDQVEKDRLREIVEKRFSFVRMGFSYRITEIEAAIGLAALKNCRQNILRRREIGSRYGRGLQDLTDHLQLPYVPADRDHSFMAFGIVLKHESKRDLVEYLEQNGIETRDIPSLLYQPIYERLFGQIESKLPVANWISESGFYIGCHEYITHSQIEHVIETFHRFFRR